MPSTPPRAMAVGSREEQCRGPGCMDLATWMYLPACVCLCQAMMLRALCVGWCWRTRRLEHKARLGSVQDRPFAKIVTRFVTYLMDTFVSDSYIAKIFEQITGHSSYETFTGPNDF